MRFFARGFQDIGVAAFLRRHGENDGALALEHLLVEMRRRQLILDLAHAGQHAHDPAEPADLFDLRQLIGQVLQVEFALAELVGHFLGFFGVDVFCRAFDERYDIAHAQNAVGDAVGMKILERVDLFAGAQKLDRLAGDGAHGKRRAAAAIAVDAGQHDAGNADAVVEVFRKIDRVLASEAIGDEQDFMRMGDILDLHHLGHEFLRRYGCGRPYRAARRHSLAGGPPVRRAPRSAPASGPR